MGMEVQPIEWKFFPRPRTFPCMSCHYGYAKNRVKVTRYPRESTTREPIVFTLCLCDRCARMTEDEIMIAVLDNYK